jgi:hypothetical protein
MRKIIFARFVVISTGHTITLPPLPALWPRSRPQSRSPFFVGPKIHLCLPRLRRHLPNLVFANHTFVPIPHAPPRPHLPSFVVTCLGRVIIFPALQPQCRSRTTATSPAIIHMAARNSLTSMLYLSRPCHPNLNCHYPCLPHLDAVCPPFPF